MDGEMDSIPNQQSWYWGNISQNEAIAVLRTSSCGQFLVRDSSIAGQYTMVVKNGSKVSCVRILKSNGLYGFWINMCIYPTLSDAIQHLLEDKDKRMLKSIFPEVDFLYPLCRSPNSSLSMCDLFLLLISKNTDCSLLQRLYTCTCKKYRRGTKEIAGFESEMSALSTVMTVYQDQLEGQEKIKEGLVASSGSEVDSILRNMQLVLYRIQHLKEQIRSKKSLVRHLEEENKQLLEEIQKIKPQMNELQALVQSLCW